MNKYVLNISYTDHVTGVGFFKNIEKVCQNYVYTIYLPSYAVGSCGMTMDQMEDIFVLASKTGIVFDYVTVADDHFCTDARLVIVENVPALTLSKDARINCPATFIFGGDL
ncbi:hypothetical protein [Burkholderia pseudomallei]|uniref:hypothetical protein n=1 Tax=Burkholderia pseudomallei TaxID=28450 RepID=UPI00105DBDBC|nr:hypothetical protein [Burkholderia pseudomallei]